MTATPPADLSGLDPASREIVAHLEAHPFLDPMAMTPVEMRAAFDGYYATIDMEPAEVATEDRVIAGPGGDLRVRVYHPGGRRDGSLPVTLFCRGGGLVMGSLSSYDTICRRICAASAAIVVAVDYRQPPEHRYPAAIDDCLATIGWIRSSAASFGGNPARIAIAGDSGGGMLAAVTTHEIRKTGEPPLDFQFLVYPAVRVLVRGPNVFAGYLGGDEREAGEWLDTGDLGVLDDKGWLTLTGRSKDLIIRSGHNIDPAVIEETAARHPAVTLAAAIGQIDDYAGEVPALYVQLKLGSNEANTLEELAVLMAREVAEPPARPRAIYVLKAMPMTAVGKIYKPALRIDAASRRIVQLLADRAIDAQSVDIEEDGGGRLVVRIVLRVEDGGRNDEIRGLIARFPVKATVPAATPGDALPD